MADRRPLVLASGTPAEIPAGDAASVPYIKLDPALATPSHNEGTMYWDSADHTLALQSEIAGSTLQVGQENWVRIVNKTGSQLNDGQVVYISGAQGNRPTAALAVATSLNADKVIGVCTANIADNAEGYVTVFGLVRGFDTSGFTAGDTLYVDATTPGALTNVAPVAPNHAVRVGYALNSTNNGSIFIAPHNGADLATLHDVLLSGLADGDLLMYKSANTRWENKAQSTLVLSQSQITNLTTDLAAKVAKTGDTMTGLLKVDLGSGTHTTNFERGNNLRLHAADNGFPSIGGLSYGNINGLTYFSGAFGGTRGSPSATPAGSLFHQVIGYGHNGSGPVFSKAYTYMGTKTQWTLTDNSTYFEWYGTPNGSITPGLWFSLINACAIVGTDPGGSETLRVGGQIAASGTGTNYIKNNRGAFTGESAFVVQSLGVNTWYLGSLASSDDLVFYSGGVGAALTINKTTRAVTIGTVASGSEFLRVGGSIQATTLSALGGSSEFGSNTNGFVRVYIRNTDAGSSAGGSLTFTNDTYPTGGGFVFYQSNANTQYGGPNSLNLITLGANPIALGVGNTVKFKINGDGTVTVNPASDPGGSEKLRVGGSIRATDWVAIGVGAVGYSGSISLSNTAGNFAVEYAQRSGASRWAWGMNGDAESSGNAGSNFIIRAYADGGGLVGDALTINRASLAASFGGAINQTGGQYHYLRGDATTDGSVRISSQASGTAQIEVRASGAWVVKQAWT